MSVQGLRTVLGVGIDVLSLARFAGLLSRRGASNVARKICSSAELELWAGKEGSATVDQLRFLSSRWAVKEAAHKAVSPLVPASSLSLRSYSLSHSPAGKPQLALDPLKHSHSSQADPNAYLATHPFFPGAEIKLLPSISHDGGIVTAIVVAGLAAEPASEWYSEPHYLGRTD